MLRFKGFELRQMRFLLFADLARVVRLDELEGSGVRSCELGETDSESLFDFGTDSFHRSLVFRSKSRKFRRMFVHILL